MTKQAHELWVAGNQTPNTETFELSGGVGDSRDCEKLRRPPGGSAATDRTVCCAAKHWDGDAAAKLAWRWWRARIPRWLLLIYFWGFFLGNVKSKMSASLQRCMSFQTLVNVLCSDACARPPACQSRLVRSHLSLSERLLSSLSLALCVCCIIDPHQCMQLHSVSQ